MTADLFGLLGLFLLALSRGNGGGKPARQSPQLPPAPVPWPAAVPEGLPAFPGPGWEYDEPPPLAVQQRASQLVAPLWRQGKGSHRTEQTAGRWITYQAAIVRSGKQGVVAFRQKGSSSVKRPPGEAQARAPAPSSPSSSSSSWTLPGILTAASPGWPQPTAGGGAVQVVAGRWYQWAARVDVPGGAIPGGDERAFAEGIARGLAAAGAVNIAVSDSAPFVLAYQLQAKQSITVPLGVAIAFEVLGVKCSITFLKAQQIEPPKAPKVPPPPNQPGWTQASAPAPGTERIELPGGTIDVRTGPAERISPLEMRDLKRGDRGEDVKTVQRRLGIKDDGVFGAETQTKVIEFQRSKGLAPNLPTEQLRARGFGAVKQATWVALFGAQA